MKHIKYLIFAVTGFIFISCDTDEFLNPLPESAVSVEQFFQSDTDVLQGVIGIYDALQGTNESTVTNIRNANRGVQFEHLLTEHRTDNTRNSTLEGSKSDFHRYVVDANNVESEDFYQSMYEAIFRANNIMDFIDIADASNQASYRAEAKFIRAYAYFKLVRLYGDIPLVSTTIGPENDAAFTRIPAAQVYDLIIADLQEAIANLDNTYRGRASKAGAQALLAKVYLTQANPNYSEARLLCEAVINGGEFDLESNYNDVFYSETNNSEVMFAIKYLSGDSQESQGFSAEFTSAIRAGRDDGQNIINDNLRLLFESNGGNRTAVSINDFDGTLPFDENEVGKFLPDGNDHTTTPAYGGNARNAGNDYIAIRFADVLLMHVEAILGAGPMTTTTSDAAALNSFQRIRNRAGLTAAVTSVSKEELLLERRIELAFENQRYFDLVRFGVLDAVLDAHSTVRGYTYDPRRALFLPIPASEINLSGGLLSQNPGY